MEKGYVKNITILIGCFLLLLVLGIGTVAVKAQDAGRKVRVAFFPMDGYNEYLPDGACTGMDVDYLNALSVYSNWNVEYVECSSWEEALQMLSNKQVDLVGSAQYSPERAEVFEYADLPSGYTFGIIAVRKGSPIAYEDFTAMEDITYGVVKSYVRREEFVEYLKNNGIKNPKIKEYTNTDELYKAFESGEIEAYTHSFTEIKEGQRIVGRFAPRPFYYITYKGNDDVLNELNQAIIDLKIKKPMLENTLFNKYYESKLDKSIVYSTAEKDYIKQKNVITVGFMDGHYPISYLNNSTIDGLCRNVMENFSKTSGLKINYMLIDDAESAIKALNDKKIDLLCYSSLTEEQITENNFRTTDAYVYIPMVIVADENGHSKGINKVAVVSDMYTEAEKAFSNDDMKYLVYDTQEKCLEAVDEGDADVALCDGYLSEYLIRQNQQYSNLEIQSVVNKDHDISMVYSSQMPEEFVGIVDKTITTISEKEISEYVMQNSTITYMSLKQFIQNYSSLIIGLLIALILVIVLVGVHMINDNKKIQKLMYKDFNMDIWNLNYLTYQASQHLPSYGKPKRAIATINISQFKLFNTLYGKDEGQKLLENVVNMISEYIEDNKEIYARDQGDRFVLFLKYETRDEFLERLNGIKKDMEARIHKETTNHMTIIIGAYLLPDDSRELQTAISNANLALEAAREDVSNSIVIYDDELEKNLKEEHIKEQLLNSVDFEKDFVAFYQAKVDIRTEQIVGAEALVRFKDPTCDGMIRAPYYFVPYYEKTGKITEIDFCVLENVCRMLRRRLDEGKRVVTVSVNFSRHHFMKSGFSSRFEAVLEKYNIPKDLIEVEITETLVVEELHQQAIKDTIDELQEKGIRLSIDDFGSGYSSLGVFEQIPASVIKLDRSFLLNQEDRERQVVIMRGIVHMAVDLEAQVVCEGVENDEDVELMKEIGAFIAQGYKYSKPIPEEEFEAKLDK